MTNEVVTCITQSLAESQSEASTGMQFHAPGGQNFELENTETTANFAKPAEPNYGSPLFIARTTIKSFGKGNLLRTRGRFFFYNSGIWKEVDNEVIKNRIHQIYQCLDPLMFESKDLTGNKVNSCLQMVATESYVDSVVFDAPRDSIGCLSGELVLVGENWELQPHVREYYRTNLIPISYDPHAIPVRFCRFLDEVFENDQDAEQKKLCLGEFMGYTLSTDCRFEKFLLLFGEHGSNGKSVILKCVQMMLGTEGWSAIHPKNFNNKFQASLLKGKFANINSELKVGDELSDDGIKRITSGEPFTCEEKHKPVFTFSSFAKLWFASNSMPHVRDHSGGFFHPPIVLQFNRRFTDKNDSQRNSSDGVADPDLKTDLAVELPGILNYALKGFRRLRVNGSFTEPQSSKDIVAEWRKSGDQVEQFIGEKCAFADGFNSLQKTLYKAYRVWVDEVGYGNTLSQQTFGKRLETLGYKKGPRLSSGTTHNGITLSV